MGPLLERAGELRAISGAVRAAAAGNGRVVVIAAPPGMGKTRLLEAGLERAAGKGMRLAHARATELERGLGWNTARDLLVPALADLTPAARRRASKGAAAAARAVLEPAAAPPKSAPDAAELPHSLYWLVAGLAGDRPLCLAVDDLQWVDGPSGRWLAYLAARIADLPVLLMVATHPPDPASGPRWMVAIGGNPSATVLRPRALSEVAGEKLVRRGLGPPDPEFARACHDATRGNPFLLEQLVDHLRREHVPPTTAAAARVRVARPETIARLLLARLAPLPVGSRELAEALAALGRSADLGLVAALAELDRADAAQASNA